MRGEARRARRRSATTAACLLATLTLGAGSAAHPAHATGLPGRTAAPRTRAPAADSLSGEELDAATARVAAELRCPVCRGQSVLESSADLSRQMQRTIRERLAAGDSPDEIKQYFVGRYGDFILLKPRARGLGIVVYALPAVALLLGGLLLRLRLGARAGRRAGVSPAPGEGALASRGDGTSRAPQGAISPSDRDWIERQIRRS